MNQTNSVQKASIPDETIQQQNFEDAFETLKQQHAAGLPIEPCIGICLTSEAVSKDAYRKYIIGASFFREAGYLDEAEILAVRAFRAAPGFGGTFHLMGDIYRDRGDVQTSTLCYRYALPQNLIRKYFPVPAERLKHAPEAHDAGVIQLQAYPAQTYDLPQPQRVEDRNIQNLDCSMTRVEGSAASTYSIPDGRVLLDGLQQAVWDSKQRILTDLCRGNPELVDNVVISDSALAMHGKVCLLQNRNSNNYYHWMNDILPALEVVRASGISLSEIDQFIVNPLTAKFQWETLEKFGIRQDKIFQISDHTHISADTLIIPIFGSNSLGMRQAPWLAQSMKRVFLPKAKTGKHQKTGKRRLYISRADAGVRGVINEAELLSRLKPYGFEIVKAAEYTVQQQAEAFADAEFILGPHGAAFSNVMFSFPGAKLIEFANPHYVTCFWGTAAMSGLEYYVLSCEPVEPDECEARNVMQQTIQQREANFYINVDEVEQILAAAGCNKPGSSSKPAHWSRKFIERIALSRQRRRGD